MNLMDLQRQNRKDVNHPMYGKKHSEESKRKMSDSHKGLVFTLKHRQNISEANKKKDTWLKKINRENKIILCGCGCGERIKIKRHHKYSPPKFIHGHNSGRHLTEENLKEMITCECGCGGLALKYNKIMNCLCFIVFRFFVDCK